MASGARSSKRKSSPSYSSKKKRRNKDRVKKRSKLGRSKSKKVSRRDSPSSYSEDESSASDSSVSYSSADSDHRRSRSRTRKNARRRREKSRRRRLRSESSEDSVQVRKRKRSKRSKDTDAKKKHRGRIHRRKPSVSSSSRSLSCSTCGSSDDSERENERNVKRVKRSGRSRRDLDEDRSRRSHRSRSCSSCRFGSNGDSYQSEEPVPNENNSRRLRSVITFVKECEEADTKGLDRDEQKEEIVYEHDDYPSPRSNDSNDWETRREASHHSDDVPGQTGSLEDQHKEMVVSNISISKLSENSDLGKVERDVNASTFNVAGVKDSSKENSSTNAGSSDADLEAVLRQKALENLKKFKGGVRANPKNPVSTKVSCDGEVKESFGLTAETEWKKKDQEGRVGGVGAASSAANKINMSVSTLSDNPEDGAIPFKKEHIGADTFMRKARPVHESSSINNSAAESLQSMGHDSKMVAPSEEGGDFTLKKGGEGGASTSVVSVPTSGIGSTVESLESPSNDVKGLIDSVDHVNDKHETGGASTLMECHGSSKLQNEMTPIQQSSKPDMSRPAQHNNAVESLQSFHDTKMVTDDDDDKTGTGLSTSDSSNLQGQSSNAKENKDEDSQFQQKTMSVMRGGEVVQVSYKVYIPKRAPALARRKLKR